MIMFINLINDKLLIIITKVLTISSFPARAVVASNSRGGARERATKRRLK